jgi:hypothetical protein
VLSGSHSSVSMRLFNDHASMYTWATSWTTAETAAAQAGNRLQLLAHVPLANQKCATTAVYLSWLPVGGINLRLQGLSLRVGAKAGRPRILPAAARK